ncbi:unnamed protein product, partial [Closterium sp. NIES-54]
EVLKAASDFFGEIFRETPAERPIDPKKKLGAEGKAILWADWTEKEVKKEVAELPNGKTPGGDGLPKELFEANWDVLGPELMRFIRDFEETAHLSESLTTAVTVLLHKKGDKGKLENYRPITLLSALYKIIVKGMANRIKRVLREVILDDQHGFLLLNGWLGEKIGMETGVRQGCPLAPYLFLCAAEPLSREINQRKLGLKKRGRGGLAYLGYADDTTLVLEGSDQIAKAGELLEEFGRLSKLCINTKKTVVLPLGRNREKVQPMDSPFKWALPGESERLLGIWITSDGDLRPSWEKAFEMVCGSLGKWAVQFLTTMARVVMINAYMMPIMLFKAQIYLPPPEFWRRIKRICHNFISGGKSSLESEKVNELPPSKIEALDGSNYEEWSGRMRSAFKHYKLLKLAMGEEKMPEEGDARDRWIEKSVVLYDLFLQSVNNDMFQHIKDLVELDDSGPKAWKLLRDVIQPNTLPMVIVLEKELTALSMQPGDDVKPVLDKIKDTYARMAAAGSNVSQMQRTSAGATRLVVLPTKLLRGMDLQEAAEEEGEGEAEAVGEALVEGEAEVTTMRGMGALVAGGALEWRVPAGKANPGMFLMVEDVKGSEADVGSVGKVVMHPLTHWVIDSGCTSHMTPRADLLDEVKPPIKIKFVDAASSALLPVIGVGNAKVMGANGGLVGLGNVLLVEGLSANLLSVRRLQRSKAKLTFDPTSSRAKLVKLFLWDLEEKNSCIKDLWQLPIIPQNGKPPATAAAAATARASTGGEEIAPPDGALDAVKKVQQTQQPHGEVLAGVDATAAWAKASSGSGETDWETWHESLLAADVLKEWMLRAQRESGHKVKVIRTDNGGEFIGADFEAVLKTKGIQHQLTVLYNPQQIGVAECFNRTLQEGARTLLGRAGLPDPFWVTALRQVALVKNRVLTTVGDKRDMKFLGSLYYKEWKQQQQKLPTTPLIIEADEVQRPFRQVQVTVSEEEISGVTEDGGEPEVEEQQQQDAPPRTQRPPDRPRRDVHPPNRLTYPSFGKPKVGPAPSGVSQVYAIEPVKVAVDSGAARGAESAGAGSGGAEPAGAGSGGAEPPGAGPGGAEPERAEPRGAGAGGVEPGVAECGGAEPDGTGPGGPSGASSCHAASAGATSLGGARTGGTGAAGPGGATGAGAAGGAGAGGAAGVGATGGTGAGAAASSGGPAGAGAAGGTGAGGAAGTGAPMGAGVGATRAAGGAAGVGSAVGVGADAGGAGAVPAGPRGAAQPRLYSLASPLPAPSPYAGPTGGLAERREPESRPASPVCAARTGRRVPRPRPPPVSGTHQMALRPSTAPQRVPLPSPPESSLPALPDPESDSLHAASSTVTRFLATVLTDPSFESTAASALVAELVDFAAHYRLDYAASLVAESASVCPPSIGGECALSMDVLEDRQEEFQCFAAALPHLVSMLLAPEGDPDAPDIPTPRSYAEVIEGPYSSQWQTAMDAQMASWKSIGTYVDEVPPPGANIVSGMWIFRVKRPPGFPPVFKMRYVARGFNQRQGVDFFQTFSPTLKMTTLRVLLHVAAQRDYELHSLDFSTTFLQGSLHEEIWLRRPPGFTGSFPGGI